MADTEVQTSSTGPNDEAPKPKPKQQDIPIPVVVESSTYKQDYLPTFREKTVYIRGKGGTGYADPTFVEYDADVEDEAWLQQLNDGQDRLPLDRFEFMIWRLDTTNAAAIERTLMAAGADQASRNTAAAVGSTDYMSADDAIAALQSGCPCRDRTARAVYDYWLTKRATLGRPLLRSLQAPTSASESNWLATFRPREKIHRPQTRRRKEAPQEAMEKMRAMRQNLLKARELIESLTRRERKKANIICVEVDIQQLQLKLRHQPKAAAEQIEADYLAQSRSKLKRPLGFEAQTGLAPGGVMPTEGPLPNGEMALLQPHEYRRPVKRKRDPLHPQLDAVAHLPPPPHALAVTFGMLAVECQPDLEHIAAAYTVRQTDNAADSTAAQASATAASAAGTRSGATVTCTSTPAVTGSGPIANGIGGIIHLLDSSTNGSRECLGLGVLFPRELWQSIKQGTARLRPSRHGRLVIDRCHPVTYGAFHEEAEDPFGDVTPMHQMPNPYITGGLKSLTIRNAPTLTGSQGSLTPGTLVRNGSRKGFPTPLSRGGSGTPSAAAPATANMGGGGSAVSKGRGPGRPPKSIKGGSPMD